MVLLLSKLVMTPAPGATEQSMQRELLELGISNGA